MAHPPSAGILGALACATAGLACAGAVGAYRIAATGDGGGPPEPVAIDERPLDADQVEVQGTLARVVGTQVAGPVLRLPLRMDVVRGGGTKATFTGGTVGGKAQVVLWDGGRPLPLSGSGALDLSGPADVEVSAAGTTWRLDGAPRILQAGSYALGATVAVGTAGLAAPRDGVTLAVPTTATVVTRGGVTVTMPPGDLVLHGPGSLLIEGDLRIRTSRGVNPAGSLRFGPGPFEVALARQPDGRGHSITRSVLQGTVAVGG